MFIFCFGKKNGEPLFFVGADEETASTKVKSYFLAHFGVDSSQGDGVFLEDLGLTCVHKGYVSEVV